MYLTRGVVGGLLLLVLSSRPIPADAATVPGNFPTVQAAINAVVSGALPDGTVIDVQPGTYFEALLINATSRSMTIRAAGGTGTAVVDAIGHGTSAIRIFSAPGTIRIEGLKFRNGQGESAGGNGGGFTFRTQDQEGDADGTQDVVLGQRGLLREHRPVPWDR